MKCLILNYYIIRNETKMILTEYSADGQQYSKVLEGEYTILVKKKPIDILKESLNYYGSDLEGAIRGSKSILGSCQKAPFRIPGETDMYWFPHSSTNDDACVWLALHHIDRIEYSTGNQTKVITTHGHSIILDISKKKLESQMGKAEKLEININKRKKPTISFFMEKEIGIHLRRDSRNYIDSYGKEEEK